MTIRIAIGADHRGYELKNMLTAIKRIGSHSIEWIDVGTFSTVRTDYPEFALKVVNLVRNGEADKGIMLCGSGIGMAMAANRFAHIYAGVVWNDAVAQAATEDDNITVVALPVDFVKKEDVPGIIYAWLSARFKKGRYQERLDMIDSF